MRDTGGLETADDLSVDAGFDHIVLGAHGERMPLFERHRGGGRLRPLEHVGLVFVGQRGRHRLLACVDVVAEGASLGIGNHDCLRIHRDAANVPCV